MREQDYSDEDLARIAGVNLSKVKKVTPKIDEASYSDEDLMKIAGINPEKGFFAKQRERGANMANLDLAVEEGKKLAPEAKFEKIGQFAGGINDVVSGLTGAAYHAGMTDKGEQRVNADLQRLAATPVGQAGIQALQKGGEIWNTYKQANPRTADLLIAGANIVGAAPVAMGMVKGLSPLTTIEKPQINLPRFKEALPTAEEIKNTAANLYKTASEKGGVLKSDMTNNFLDEIEKVKPTPIAGKLITSEDKKIIDAVDEFKVLRDTPLTLDDAQRLDEALGKKIDSFIDLKTGKPNKDGIKIMELQDKLRSTIDEAPEDMIEGGKEGFEALKDARKAWSNSIKVRDIERILERAKMMDNEATSIKAGFRTLYNNPNRMRGYTAAEKAAIKQAAESGIVGGTLRTILGSRLLGTMVGTGAGTAAGGPFGAAVGAGLGAAQSGLSRKVAAGLQTRRANKVIEEIGRNQKTLGKK